MRIEGVRPGARTSRRLVSTYFDTPKHKFRRHGLTLRVRQAGDDFQQTVKSSAVGGFTRGEWEAELPDATPSLRELDRTPLAELATRKLKRKLKGKEIFPISGVSRQGVEPLLEKIWTLLQELKLAQVQSGNVPESVK